MCVCGVLAMIERLDPPGRSVPVTEHVQRLSVSDLLIRLRLSNHTHTLFLLSFSLDYILSGEKTFSNARKEVGPHLSSQLILMN